MKFLKIPRRSSIAIVYRPNTTIAFNLAKTLANWLNERGYNPFTAPEQKIILGTKLLKNTKALEKMGLLIVLGGDGTYLRAVRLLQGKSVPILGINLGQLGFLTPSRIEDMFGAVENTLAGKMQLRPRSMLDVKIFRHGKIIDQVLGLNDVVLERGSLSQLINLSIFAGDALISTMRADGLIISSPTGSTAYNLAAGGPILHPELSALVVTPVAPHSLTNRPLILSDKQKLRFCLSGKHHLVKQKAHLVVDGMKIRDLVATDEVVVTRARATHLLVRDPGFDYYQLLREKLKFGERT